MKILLLQFLSCLFVLTACSQSDSLDGYEPVIVQHKLPLAATSISVQHTSFTPAAPFLLFQLHSNETTAAATAAAFARQHAVPFVQLLNGKERLISFRYQGRLYQFDPNRIFSDVGIKKTLQLSGRYSVGALQQVQRFRDSLLRFLPAAMPVVAVHNNRDGTLSISQYRQAGIGDVHVNEDHDPDDFFITNDVEIFALLKAEGVNVVREEATQTEDDGSLSMYCSRLSVRYVNVEAQHGHAEQQLKMLQLLHRIFN